MEDFLPNGQTFPLLQSIHDPKDVKALSQEELEQLAEEIRKFLIDRVLENGGHLASNLGVVEMTLAIHRVFSSPHDHIIFDVGHQCYIHKLLTDRWEHFDTLRQGGGVGGFPKRSESEHDCFGTGHSSTSLSAALGFAEADKLQGSDAYTVCVFGDGAYTGGMIHEALNNCKKRLRLIIILNENEMSISKNIGRFAKTLSHLRASQGYFRTKQATASFLRKIPLIGKPIFNGLLSLKMAMKSALYGSNYFEKLGLYYLGPVNGNDEEAVEKLLQEAKKSGQSCIVHLKTKKGKGYIPAEDNPDRYHGMSPRNVGTPEGANFSVKMGEILTAIANKDERICAITAAMTGGTGLTSFRNTHPAKFFDVGIAEPHAVTFAAGLAANGLRPVVAVYSTFLQRAYDNIVHDVALQNLPVVFCIDRAGLNASDGPTHHGIFDVAFLSQIPNLTIYTPITYDALESAMRESLNNGTPCAIRYPSGYESEKIKKHFYGANSHANGHVRSDFAREEADSLDAVIITHGRIITEAVAAQHELAQKGVKVGILLLEMLKPYDRVAEEMLSLLPKSACKLLFLEEEIRAGGMGMMLCDALRVHDAMQNKQVIIKALDDEFGIQTKHEPIFKSVGLDCEAIIEELLH